jgi:hypothetical protein
MAYRGALVVEQDTCAKTFKRVGEHNVKEYLTGFAE